MDVTKIPFGAGLGRRSVYDLERGRNGYGREIFVEQRCDTTGKPTIWYEFNGQGILTKHVRKGGGIDLTRLGKSPYL